MPQSFSVSVLPSVVIRDGTLGIIRDEYNILQIISILQNKGHNYKSRSWDSLQS